jgi:putative FmdB family regulatory protein
LPLYEFYCESCQLKFEALKTVDERHEAQCPQCGKSVPKVMSIVNHTFGWTLSDRSHERFGPRDEFVKNV